MPPELSGLIGRLESGPIDSVLAAECAALEPRACRDRAIALLGDDAGESKLVRAIGLLRAACARELAEACADLKKTGRPRAIVAPSPQYTHRAVERGVVGTSTVKCRLPVDGRPRDCVILRSLPEFNQEVLSALARSLYEPATIAGVPVEVMFVWNFRFSLPGRSAPPLPEWKPVLYQPLLDRCAGEAATRCTDEARLLARKREHPGDADRAARLFSAACEQGDRAACDSLRNQYWGPQRLDELVPTGVIPPEALPVRGEFVCWITATGEVQRCRVTKSTIVDEIWMDAASKIHFRPALLDGKPFETEYGFAYGPVEP